MLRLFPSWDGKLILDYLGGDVITRGLQREAGVTEQEMWCGHEPWNAGTILPCSPQKKVLGSPAGPLETSNLEASKMINCFKPRSWWYLVTAATEPWIPPCAWLSAALFKHSILFSYFSILQDIGVVMPILWLWKLRHWKFRYVPNWQSWDLTPHPTDSSV